MKKQITALIIGITAITVGVISLQKETYSTSGITYAKPNSCYQATVNEIDLMRMAWNKNLKDIMEQEKAASELVDEGFESMRTYNCWLNYLCDTVLLAGNVSAEAALRGKITKLDIDPIPGCVYPEEVVIPGTKLKYISQCKVSKGNIDPTLATKYYNSCNKLIELESASAYVGLEGYLKSTSATKKNTVLQKKLNTILSGMYGMETHMTYLEKYMEAFDSLLKCQISKCD